VTTPKSMSRAGPGRGQTRQTAYSLAMTRPAIVRSLRRWMLGAAGVLGIGLVLALVVIRGDPALRDSWIAWATVLLLVCSGTAVALRAVMIYSHTKRTRDDWSEIRNELRDQRAINQKLVAIWTILLIGWLTALFMVSGPALGTSQLQNPVRVGSISVQTYTPCLRGCSLQATATFPLNGRVVTAQLRGLSQDSRRYHSGMEIVYDARNPDIAMAASDYKSVSADDALAVIAVATLIFAVGTWYLVKRNGRSRATSE
jgi:hypothetical protein